MPLFWSGGKWKPPFEVVQAVEQTYIVFYVAMPTSYIALPFWKRKKLLWRNLIPAVSMTNEKGFWGRDNCHGYHVANRNFYSSLLFTDEINPNLRLIWLSWKLQASLPCEMCFCLLLLYKYLECALSIMSVSIMLNLISREIDLLLSNPFSPLPHSHAYMYSKFRGCCYDINKIWST